MQISDRCIEFSTDQTVLLGHTDVADYDSLSGIKKKKAKCYALVAGNLPLKAQKETIMNLDWQLQAHC